MTKTDAEKRIKNLYAKMDRLIRTAETLEKQKKLSNVSAEIERCWELYSDTLNEVTNLQRQFNL